MTIVWLQSPPRQREVAEQVPISPGHLSRLETGDYGPPPDEVIERLAEVLGADRLDLLQLAGRDPGRRVFEERVLEELQAIREGIEALRGELRLQ